MLFMGSFRTRTHGTQKQRSALCVSPECVASCPCVDKAVYFNQHGVSAVSFWTPCAGAAGLPNGVLAARSAAPVDETDSQDAHLLLGSSYCLVSPVV